MMNRATPAYLLSQAQTETRRHHYIVQSVFEMRMQKIIWLPEAASEHLAYLRQLKDFEMHQNNCTEA